MCGRHRTPSRGGLVFEAFEAASSVKPVVGKAAPKMLVIASALGW